MSTGNATCRGGADEAGATTASEATVAAATAQNRRARLELTVPMAGSRSRRTTRVLRLPQAVNDSGGGLLDRSGPTSVTASALVVERAHTAVGDEPRQQGGGVPPQVLDVAGLQRVEDEGAHRVDVTGRRGHDRRHPGLGQP